MNNRIGRCLRQNIRAFFIEVIDTTTQLLIKQRKVNTIILLGRFLPTQSRVTEALFVSTRRPTCTRTKLITASYKVTVRQIQEPIHKTGSIRMVSIITYNTIRSTYLQEINYWIIFQKFFLSKYPSPGNCREETITIAWSKVLRTIITHIAFNQVFIIIIIRDTTYQTNIPSWNTGVITVRIIGFALVIKGQCRKMMQTKITFPVKTGLSIPVTRLTKTFGIADQTGFTVLNIHNFIGIGTCRMLHPCYIFPIPRLITLYRSSTLFGVIISAIVGYLYLKLQSFGDEIQFLC